MAKTKTVLKNNVDDKSITSREKRKLQPDMEFKQTKSIKKLKDKNTLGKDKICQCPQLCSERVPQKSKDELLKMFMEIDDDVNLQNLFLLKFIEARPVADRLFTEETAPNGKLLRRIYCKYRIPLNVSEDFISTINSDSDEDDADEDTEIDETYSMTSADSKEDNGNNIGLANNTLVTYGKLSTPSVDVCQRAFINLFGLSDNRLKQVRELLIVKARQNHLKLMMRKEENQIVVSLAKDLAESCMPLVTLFNPVDGRKICDQLMVAINNDINLVNNFFWNQLWKPEYINDKPSYE